MNDLRANHPTELIESLLISSECEASYVGSLLRVGEPALELVGRFVEHQLVELPRCFV
jgi:hypothetical protein